MDMRVENPWFTRAPERVEPGREGTAVLTAIELCAGAGGQALGFEQAGIDHVGLLDIDKNACATLRLNRPNWNVLEGDLNSFDGAAFGGVDIVAGGLPCPPFSVAGKQLGHRDERNLFPAMIRLVDQIRPKAVMIENVRGILDAVFQDYREYIAKQLTKLGYQTGWKLMNASDFGVSQLRPRVVCIAVRRECAEHFSWPEESRTPLKTVGELLYDLMVARGWRGAKAWREQANEAALGALDGSLWPLGPCASFEPLQQ